MQQASIPATLDDSGRLEIPAQIRVRNNWEVGDKINVYHVDHNTVMLQAVRVLNITTCGICKTEEVYMRYNCINFCRECTNGITKLNAKLIRSSDIG